MTLKTFMAAFALLAIGAAGIANADAASARAPHPPVRAAHSRQCDGNMGIDPGYGSPRCRMQQASAPPSGTSANYRGSQDELPPAGGSGVPAFMYGRLHQPN